MDLFEVGEAIKLDFGLKTARYGSSANQVLSLSSLIRLRSLSRKGVSAIPWKYRL